MFDQLERVETEVKKKEGEKIKPVEQGKEKEKKKK